MNSPTILVPVGKNKELPDHAIIVLRSLWSRLGYQGSAFVDMQLEINKELLNADFARFEREMLCNEIISLRQELGLVRKERDDHIRRAEVSQSNLNQVLDAEERTFKTLLSERESAKRAIERAEKGIQKVVIAKEKEAVRAEAMTEELQRLEKERLAALLYAKTAEEQASIANVTAKAATAVAVSAVQSPRSIGSITPRTPVVSERGIPSPRVKDSNSLHSLNSSNLSKNYPHNHHSISSFSSPVSNLGISTPNSVKNFNCCNQNLVSTSSDGSGWTLADEAILQSKIRERNLEEQENRLTDEVSKLVKDRLNLKLDQDKLSLNSNYNNSNNRRSSSTSSSLDQYSPYENNIPQKTVVWNNPLEFSLD